MAFGCNSTPLCHLGGCHLVTLKLVYHTLHSGQSNVGVIGPYVFEPGAFATRKKTASTRLPTRCITMARYVFYHASVPSLAAYDRDHFTIVNTNTNTNLSCLNSLSFWQVWTLDSVLLCVLSSGLKRISQHTFVLTKQKQSNNKMLSLTRY